MARQKRDDAELLPETAETSGEVAAAPASKRIKFTAFKTYTSRGRRLAGDEDDFDAAEADELIASGVAVAC